MVGHAFEARIYAENPRNDFLPDSGRLIYLSTPEPTTIFAPPLPPVTSIEASAASSDLDAPRITPSVRLEQGFGAGAQIGVFYDPMIAKLVVHAEDRTAALRVLRKALDEYKVVGVSTNIEFLRTLAGHEAFIAGEVETSLIPKHREELFPPIPAEPSAEVLAQAALFTVLRDQPLPTASPWSRLAARRFNGDALARTITLQADVESAAPVSVSVTTLPTGHFDITVHSPSGSVASFDDVAAHLAEPTELVCSLAGRARQTTIVPISPLPLTHMRADVGAAAGATAERLHIFSDGTRTVLALPAPSWVRALAEETLGGGGVSSLGALRAPMPSVVVDVRVAVGERVEAGALVVVLESMKTETGLRAPYAGVVTAVMCAKGEMVEEGKELVDIEQDAKEAGECVPDIQ